MLQMQDEVEWRIISKMKCRNCGLPLYNNLDDYFDGVDIKLLFDVPFCTAGCAAEFMGYQGDAIF